MFNVGDKVSFFSLNEEFNEITNINWFVENRNYYTITKFDGTEMWVKSKEEAREIQVINVFDEYQVFTPESLTKHLQSLNHAHVAVCNKIKQLYSRQQFQFKGIYQ